MNKTLDLICRILLPLRPLLAKKNKAVILMYHGFTNKKARGIENLDGKHVEVKKFEEQVKYLTKHYNIISLVEFVKLKNNLPSNSAILTFDDGYYNNYRCAFPILKKYRIPATIFLSTGFVNTSGMMWTDKLEQAVNRTKNKEFQVEDRLKYSLLQDIKKNLKNIEQERLYSTLNNMLKGLKIRLNNKLWEYKSLTWEQIKEMHKHNIDFGSHGDKHLILTKAKIETIEEDLKISNEKLKRNLKKVDFFAYPNGDYNDEVISILKKNGFAYALTTKYGFNDSRTDCFKLRRVTIDNNHSFLFFKANLSVNLRKVEAAFNKLAVLFGKQS